jgi:hypothetical protein
MASPGFSRCQASFSRLRQACGAAGPTPPANLDAAHLSDRQTDLDFHFGVWKAHSSRLLHPLTGSTTWADMDGESMVRKVWGGRACLAEYQAEDPGRKGSSLTPRIFLREILVTRFIKRR